MTQVQLAEILYQERVKRRLSLRDAAEASGVSASLIWGLEHANRNVRYDTLRRLLAFYGLQFNIERVA